MYERFLQTNGNKHILTSVLLHCRLSVWLGYEIQNELDITDIIVK